MRRTGTVAGRMEAYQSTWRRVMRRRGKAWPGSRWLCMAPLPSLFSSSLSSAGPSSFVVSLLVLYPPQCSLPHSPRQPRRRTRRPPTWPAHPLPPHPPHHHPSVFSLSSLLCSSLYSSPPSLLHSHPLVRLYLRSLGRRSHLLFCRLVWCHSRFHPLSFFPTYFHHFLA